MNSSLVIHNPKGLRHPGNGWRFLNQDELRTEHSPRIDFNNHVQYWEIGAEAWEGGSIGMCYKGETYRTDLSPEQLRTYIENYERQRTTRW